MKTLKIKKNLFNTLLIIAIASLCGCAHYKAGCPTEKLPFDTLYIEPVANKSFAPQAQSVLTTQIRQQFMQEGRLKLSKSADDAQAILYVTLEEYTTSAAGVQDRETSLGLSFDISLRVSLSLYDTQSQTYYFKGRSASSSLKALSSSGAQPTRDQSLPALTELLALKIKNSVTSVW